MTTLTSTYPTMQDMARRQDANGQIQTIYDLISPTNEILDYIPWGQCNEGTHHRTTILTGYPTGTWRQLYQGVQPEKSQTRQVTDTTGMLESYAEIDKALYELNGQGAAWRLSEEAPFMKGMAKTFVSTLFYGNTATDPEKFTGLAARYTTPSTTRESTGYNMVDGGAADGQTDCTSIWLLGFGPDTLHGIYPKGETAGWTSRDLGEATKVNSDGSMYQVIRNHYKWACGISLRNWRYTGRICNIDVSTLLPGFATGPKLWDLMTILSDRIESHSGANMVWCMNRTIRSMLRRQIIEKAAPATASFETIAGKRVMQYDGIPIALCDGILDTETAIADAAGTFVTQ